jgi:di/tricarboxylate transporter
MRALAMAWEAWFTIGVLGLVLAMLVFTRHGPDLILVGGLTLLLVSGILPVGDALSGLANPGMVTVGVLFVVAQGLRETGGMSWIGQRLLGQPRSTLGAQARLMGPVAVMSAFLNNTPIVAMFIPTVLEWSRKCRISPSKLLIPLSYASIFGGVCTLIGTSTNLVVNGLLMSEAGRPSLGMFDIAWIGVPCAAVGMGYMLLVGRRLLPDRKPPISTEDDPRQYTIAMRVPADSPLVGRSIEQAGLRRLPGAFVMEIDRGGEILPAVSPDTPLHADDVLVFVGIIDSVLDLQKMRGLQPATNQVFKLDSPRSRRCLIEAVVSNSCRAVGQTIRDSGFRNVYNAVVIAVARNGEQIRRKIGDIVLRPGDTLLLETTPDFAVRQRNSRDFYLVSAVDDSAPPRHEKAWMALAILAAMIAVVTMGLLSMLEAAMLAAGLMILTRCITGNEARRSVDWQVLVVIAAALGVGRAMDLTGAAAAIAQQLIDLARGNPWLTLVAVYLVTTLFTEIITNNAAAVLVFPIAMSASRDLGVDVMPFVFTIMVAASASFATPLGYQTNLMVYGPGGYRVGDYLRVGLPLNGLMAAVTVTLVPWIWPF